MRKSSLAGKALLTMVGVAFIGVGCAKPPSYQDPNSTGTLTTDFGYSDVRSTAQAMIESMLTSPATADITSKRRPIIVLERIKNETDQHINMTDLGAAIRTQLTRSGRFRFTEKEGRESMSDEIAYQNRSGMVNTETATARGQQLGSEYQLSGRLVSYRESYERQVKKTYRLTLRLSNLQTGIIEWEDEKAIAKGATRGAVGW